MVRCLFQTCLRRTGLARYRSSWEIRWLRAWLVSLNGIPVDARTLPAELQDEARRLGLIPGLDAQRVA